MDEVIEKGLIGGVGFLGGVGVKALYDWFTGLVPIHMLNILGKLSVEITFSDGSVETRPLALDRWYVKTLSYKAKSAWGERLSVGVEDETNFERADDWADISIVIAHISGTFYLEIVTRATLLGGYRARVFYMGTLIHDGNLKAGSIIKVSPEGVLGRLANVEELRTDMASMNPTTFKAPPA